MSHVARAVFALCTTVAMSGCLFTDPDCGGDAVWVVFSQRSIIADGPSRITYRVVLTITEEGSASEAGAPLHSSAMLQLTSWRDGSNPSVPEHVGIGFSRADGSGERYFNATGLFVEDVLGDCEAGTCTREFRAWLDSDGPGLVGLNARLRVTGRICGSDEELSRWFTIEVEPLE